MLKTLRIIFDSILLMVFALFLGYAFSAGVLKGFIPDAWALPGAFPAGVGFFFMLRWLRTEKSPPRPKNDFSLLQARTLYELAERDTQSQFQQSRLRRKEQGEQIQGTVARAATKLKGCTGQKRCHSQ